MVNRELFINSLPGWLFTPTYQKWIRYLIIFGVFAFSILLGVLQDMRLIVLVVGILLIGVVAIVFLRRPQLGIVVVLITCFTIPAPLTGIGSKLLAPFLLILLLVGLWIFDMLARERRIHFITSRTQPPALALLVVVLIAFFNGRINYYNFVTVAPLDAQLGGLMVFIISVLAFLLVANVVKEIKWLERLTWVFLAFAAVYLIGRTIPITRVVIRHFFQEGSDASIFWTWLVAITSSQLLFNRQLQKRWRWMLVLLLAGAFYVSLVQAYDWKSGWLPAMIAFFVVIWFRYPRFRIPGLVIGILLVLFNYLIDVDQLLVGGEDYSILTRLAAWRIVLEIVKVNPLLGLGLSNYYWYTPLFPILGYTSYFSSHNNYVDLIAQTGLIGLACFLWLAWQIGRLGWELRSEVPDGFAKAYVIGALGGLAGTLAAGMLGDWILPFVYNVGMVGMRSSLFAWMFLGGLVALEQIVRHPNNISRAN